MSEWTYCRTLLDMLPLPRLHAGSSLPREAIGKVLASLERHHLLPECGYLSRGEAALFPGPELSPLPRGG